jgi:hypothetical protein
MMSDKARELAEIMYTNKPPVIDIDKELIPQYAALIDAALLAARLEAIEECKAFVKTVCSNKLQGAFLCMGLDSLKEAKNADA